MGVYAGRPKFTLMSESQAKADQSKCDLQLEIQTEGWFPRESGSVPGR
jgi:hypothetical protein